MAKKRRCVSCGTAPLFSLILCFSFILTLVSVSTTSNKLLPVASIPSTIKNIFGDIFMGNQLILNLFKRVEISRPDSCNACFPHNFDYVINNEVMCKIYDDSKEIDLVIFIFTTHKRQSERQFIRQTWLNYTSKNKANVRYLFLLGEVPDENLRHLIEEENIIYGDILKEDFVDAYQNLTYKTMMAFKYATEKCSHANFFFKTDDDIWVNIPGLLKVIQREKITLQTAVGGSCFQVADPVRNPDSKWFSSLQSYPHTFYPGYCAGAGYVTSINIVKEVYEISKDVPFFHLEDVYVALCVRKLGYKLQRIQGFNSSEIPFEPCLYKGDNLITAHEVSLEKLEKVWNTPCTH